mgnify:CR=1 FL=1
MQLNRFPKDLWVVLAAVLLTMVFVIVPPLNETFVRMVLGPIMVLFLPGYSLISALFPRKKDLDGIERIALSFGLSIAITPLLGLILNYTPFGIRQIPSLISISIFTIICTIMAYIRRSKVNEKERFVLSFTYKPTLPKKRIDKALTIILILSILASISALIYVIVTPKRGEKFTEFYILGPGGMADNYPKNLKIGENGTVIIGIVNHEYELINYTLQITLGDKLLKETTIKLNHNETFTENFTFSPKEKGRKKLKFLLYKGGSGEPYRLLHLWIDVK